MRILVIVYLQERNAVREWEKKFDIIAQKKGRELFHNSRVQEVNRNADMVQAAVIGAQRYEISIRLKENMPVRMKCQCPKARGGSNCEHMAAVLYSVFGDTAPVEKEQAAEAGKRAEAVRRKTEQAKKAAVIKKAEEEARREAQEEARRKAQEEARQETARRIAERNAEKAAKKAERKRKREEAEKAARQAALEAERIRREEQERLRREAAAAAGEAAKKALEEAQRKAQEEEAARKKAKKIQEAIARKEREKVQEKEEQDTQEYQYFDVKKIRADMQLSDKSVRTGRNIYENGKMQLDKFQTGYMDRYDYDGLVAEARGTGLNGGDRYQVSLVFSRDQALIRNCTCPACRKRWYYDLKDCAYIAALLQACEDYLKANPVGDATNRTGGFLLQAFEEKRATEVVAETAAQEESIILEPRLRRQEESLYLSFKIDAGKAYVIKDLFEFCGHVRRSETAVYGTNTKINHRFGNFTKNGRKWFDYINRVVQEEERLELRLEESLRNPYRRSRKCSSLELYGWRLDQFFEVMGSETVEFEEKTGDKKEKFRLGCKEANPELSMYIRHNDLQDTNVFHGVEVRCKMPIFFQGADTLYYIKNNFLCKTQQAFMEPVMPLVEQSEYGEMEFQVGRSRLAEFYYSILPLLRESMEIIEENAEEIHAYLPPEVQFVFYLDAAGGDISCRLHAKYGNREVSVLDILDQSRKGAVETFRMVGREREVLHMTAALFPETDYENDALCCGGDEERMYRVLEYGVEELAELGEVQCTRKFRDLNVIRKVKLSVGVTVASGLLDLDIDTEDISREELLEVLRGYRSRKKYFRLKNGSFLNLEDQNIRMLGELMEAMQLSPGEFVKGKMYLPVYRTLYLDKMLEENEGIYSKRDSHFRQMVKNFKTVKEADYEVPDSLVHTMRGYQITGYKWLRTLESCQFGGILADDMGLGKTLQMIAVLLAAKEEGANGTSLIISPASLVFNWGEEFFRFAPQLNVLLLTGSQEERQKKLESCQEYDVLVTSYDLLKRDIAFYEDKQFAYEVIDEAQYIKNHTTAVAKAVKLVKSRMRIALTGTPVENRLSELWSIFDYLMPGFLYRYEVFKKEIETPIVKNKEENAMKRLQKMVAPFILRRLKTDVLTELPDKLEEIRYVQFEDAQRKIYDAQVVQMQQRIAQQDGEDFRKNKMQILAELTKLRQVCCDPALCFENYRGNSAKLEACLELIQNAIDGGHKILVFSQFTSMLEILQQGLESQNIRYNIITGATPKEKRLQMVRAFNEDSTPVFLISLKAGGVGLNLTGADVVIHYDPWWNLAVQNQATDRAYRIGQTRKVTVYKLIARHTIEEKIQKLQESKKDLADQIIGAGQLGGMSREELLELLEA